MAAAAAVALSLFLLAPLCESFSSLRKSGYAPVDLSVVLDNATATQSVTVDNDHHHATQRLVANSINNATQSLVANNINNATRSLVPNSDNAKQSLVLLKNDTPSLVLSNKNNATQTVVEEDPMSFALVQLQTIWREDVFDNPTLEPGQVLHMIFQHKTDWLILAITTVLLVTFDTFVLRPMADGRDHNHSCQEAITTSTTATTSTQGGPGCSGEDDGQSNADACVEAGSQSNSNSKSKTNQKGNQKMGGPTGHPHSSQCTAWEDAAGDSHPTANKTSSTGRSTRGNLAALGFWIAMAGVYMGIVWARRGEEAAVQWCTGYLLEWLLSLDNLFVFHLIFRTYGTPKEMVHKALFLGILGAVVFRMLFFMVLTSLLRLVKWVRVVFGLLLIYSGIEAARGDDDDVDVADTWVVKCLKQCLGSRLVESYDRKDHALFVKGKDGERKATLLVFVIICLELTDIFFAVDSVSAKVAQIPNFYIAYSSSILAIFGLRAMFFLIQDMVDAFDLLKYGLCFILVFIGVELMLADWVQLPAQAVCAVILSVFFLGVGGSLAQHYVNKNKKGQESVRDASSVA